MKTWLRKALFISVLVAGLLFPGIANAAQAVVGMPFTGQWARDSYVNPPYTDSNSSHPSVHWTPGSGDWGTDLYGSAGTAVRLYVTSYDGNVTFSWLSSSTSCGTSTRLAVYINGAQTGTLYFAHLSGAVTSGPITNGMTLGTLGSFGCNPGNHIHVEFKNSTAGYSCWGDYGSPGQVVNQQSVLGVLGSSNSGPKQACPTIPGPPPPPPVERMAFVANGGAAYRVNDNSPWVTICANCGVTAIAVDGSRMAFVANGGAAYRVNDNSPWVEMVSSAFNATAVAVTG